jgi:hypothetical protein
MGYRSSDLLQILFEHSIFRGLLAMTRQVVVAVSICNLKLGAYLGGIRDSIRQCVQLGLGLAIVEIGWVIHRAHCSLRHTRTDDSFMYGRGFWHSIMPLKWLNSFPSNFTEIFLSYQW